MDRLAAVERMVASLTTELSAAHERVAELEAVVGELRREAVAPAAIGTAEVHGTTEVDDGGEGERTAAAEPARVDRRGMLRHVGAAAAGAAVASAAGAVAGATPAAATDGLPIIIGGPNSSESQTGLNITGTGLMNSNVLLVQDANLGGAVFPAAVAGYGAGNKVNHGVYGFSAVGSGHGVVGRNTSPSAGNDGGYGVFGVATGSSASGVSGRATGVEGIGVFGTAEASDGRGVVGQGGPGGAGVVGLSNGGTYGVLGANESGIGVQGQSQSGAGVAGSSVTGSGVEGNGPIGLKGDGLIGLFTTGSFASIMLGRKFQSPPSQRSGLQAPGALDIDDDTLWYCTLAGSPGTWLRVVGPDTAGALTLLSAPVRVYDSRPNNPPEIGSKTKLSNGAVRTIDCKANNSGVPIGATAVLVNITVVNTSTTGYVSLYRNGITPPATSTVNWDHTNQVIANTTITAIDAAGFCAAKVPLTSSCDLFLDIIGYYR